MDEIISTTGFNLLLDFSGSGDFSTDLYTDFSTTESVLETVPPHLNLTLSKPHKAQLILYDILIPTLGSLIIILNFAVVISSGLILKKGNQPRSTYLFLGNVALCDLVTGIAVIFGQLYPKSSRDQLTCGIQLGLIVSSTLTSIYSVGLIALDRYLYIIHGLQYQRWVYPTRARLLILFTWIIGCVVGFLPVMGWSGDTLNGKVCWFIRLVPPKLVMMTCLIGLIPILVVIVLYSIILYYAIKKVVQLRRAANSTTANAASSNETKLRIFVGRSNTTQNTTNASNEEEPVEETAQPSSKNFFRRIFMKKPHTSIDLKAPSKIKAIKVVLFVTGSFIITWVPYFVASFIYVNCDPEKTPKKCKNLQVLIASPLAILGFCNSLLNPIIYAWWHKGFRTFVKNLINKHKKDSMHGSSSAQTPSNGTKSTNSSSTKKASISGESNQTKEQLIQMVEVNLETHM